MEELDRILSKISDEYVVHKSTEYWGESIFLVHRATNSICRIYWFADNDVDVYLDSLSVSDVHQKQGIGTKLQEIREEIGIACGFEFSNLQVDKGSWMSEWYARRGYKISEGTKCEWGGHMWMEKKIKNL